MTERTEIAHPASAPIPAPLLGLEMDSRTNERAALNAFPVDLIGAFILTLGASAASLLESPPLVRVPMGILLVMALPGFALISALFPSADGPDGVARATLSVALSLATIP